MFPRAVAKRKNCKIGRACGLGCVPQSHNCKRPLKHQAKTAVQWLAHVTANPNYESEVNAKTDKRLERFNRKIKSRSAIAKVEKLLADVKNLLKQDLKYLDLVNKGDIDSAQKLVEKQAKKAGYNVGPVYHSTPDTILPISKKIDFYKEKASSIVDSAIPEIFEKINKYLESINIQTKIADRETAENFIKYGGSSILTEKEKSYVQGTYSSPDVVRENYGSLSDDEKRIVDDKPFMSFSRKHLGENTEARDAKSGFFFTPNPDFSKRFTYGLEKDELTGEVIEKKGKSPGTYNVFLQIKKLADLTSHSIENATKLIKSGQFPLYEGDPSSLSSTLRNADGSKSLQSYLANRNGLDYFDGIKNNARHDGKVETEYSVKNPNQIKSANPLERDNKGRIVPLSKRFDDKVADIRGSTDRNPPIAVTKKLNEARAIAQKSGDKSSLEFLGNLSDKIKSAYGGNFSILSDIAKELDSFK